MKISRRHMLLAGAAAAGTGLVSGAPILRAATRIEFGAVRIDTLSDGYLSQSLAMIVDRAPREGAEAILRRHGLVAESVNSPCNVTVMRRAGRVVLFDAGSGDGFVPTAGRLLAALDGLGVTPDAVTDIVFTHGHADHLWGVLDAFDEPTFVNARYFMGRREFDYWRDPATAGSIGERRLAFAIGARRRLDRLAARFTLIEDGQEVLPGVMAHASFGHSPGHMVHEIRDGARSLMIVGDCLPNPHIAFEQPGWPSGTDQDTAAGARSRQRLLARLAHEAMPFVGFHLPGGGLGRAEPRGRESYRFTAEI